MKKTIKALALALAALSLVLSCTKSSKGEEGFVSFQISQDEEVALVTKSSVGSFTTLPSPDDFRLVIVNSSDEEIPVSDPKGLTSLPAGNYTVKASFGSSSEEGFDKPCFYGEQTFSINGGQTSAVTVKTTLANAIVRFEYSENFRKYYTDYSFTLTSGKGTQIQFPASETRAAFVDAYLIKVKGSLTSQGGKTQEFPEKEYKGLDAATCYTLRFDASNVGSSIVTISFNDTVEDVDLGETELND